MQEGRQRPKKVVMKRVENAQEFYDAFCSVKERGERLGEMSVSMRDNREMVKWAVQNDGILGTAMSFASERLKHDRPIALAAVERSRYALRHIADALKADPEIVLIAVKQSGYALEDSHLRHDPDIVIAAVSQEWDALRLADKEALWNNKEFMLRLGAIDGVEALIFAHEDMRRDRDVVTVCVRQNKDALNKAHKSMKRAPMLPPPCRMGSVEYRMYIRFSIVILFKVNITLGYLCAGRRAQRCPIVHVSVKIKICAPVQKPVCILLPG